MYVRKVRGKRMRSGRPSSWPSRQKRQTLAIRSGSVGVIDKDKAETGVRTDDDGVISEFIAAGFHGRDCPGAGTL